LSDWLGERGYSVATAATGRRAIEMARADGFQIGIVDLKLPDSDGLEVLRQFKQITPEMEVIIITAYGTVETAVEAMKEGAYNYIVKPFELKELGVFVERIIAHRELIAENIRLHQELRRAYGAQRIIGRSPQIQKVLQLIEDVAETDSTVLIEGPSGSGKELVAQAIHYASSRRDRPFIATSCGALPEGLLESELFGHERGAFTGAIARQQGKFELAHRGTLFLDEIITMTHNVQVHLLRILEEREFRRVGGKDVIRVDVRIVAASNEDVRRCVEEGRFREDLYFRLNVVPIRLPSLAERKEDIPILAEHFLKKHSLGKGKSLSPDALGFLVDYPWPGNVRELENIIERAIVLGKRKVISPDDLPPAVQHYDMQSRPAFSPDQSIQSVEKEHILNVLREAGWNKVLAAEILGIRRMTLYNKIAKYGLTDGDTVS
ncbi:MAG: sigma-54 dependent transcriptional regulator, partial [Candidatus Latescibacterota bacterium]